MKVLILVFIVIFSQSLFALSETNYKIDYQEKIIPLMNSFKDGFFKGENNVSIHYATYTSNNDAKKCLLIFPGRSEPLEKYAEVVYDLDHGVLASKLKFFLMDHRGQGRSERLLNEGTDSQFKGYVDQFDNYALDVKTFIDKIVRGENCGELNVLAHSLGAGILVDFMQKNPEYIDRAFLTSPMLKIQTKPYQYAVARSIVLASILAGKGKSFAIGQKTFSGVRNFEQNAFTTSKERYEMTMDLFDFYPEAKLGGVTNKWLNEVMSGTAEIRNHYDELRIPLRVAHAGIETYSERSEMMKLCEEAPYCNRLYLESSKHEVLMDRDINRNKVISELEKFLLN